MLVLKPDVTKENRELFFWKDLYGVIEHNWANSSETICPEMLVFGK